MAVHVTSQSALQAKLEEAGQMLVVIDFFATWCGPCKMIAPQIEEMAQHHRDVIFLKVDVDECEEIAVEYGISAMPTFVFIKNKEKLEVFSGANYPKLQELVARLK